MKEELYNHHYENHPLLIERIERREIGLQLWGAEGINDRHHYYKTLGDLQGSLVARKNIAAIFASVAYYEDPMTKSTGKKGYKGSDLVFDLDEHVEGSRYDWMFRICDRTLDLVNTLTQEVGIPESSLVIDFSGSKGFHITVNDPTFTEMHKDDRNHLIQYLLGEKIDKSILGRERGGWSDRYNNYKQRLAHICSDNKKLNESILVEFFDIPKANAKKLGGILSDASVRDTVKEHRLEVDAGLEKSLQTLFLRSERNKFAPVDKKVTGDRHRIFRVPGSIHPKTGFVSVRVLLEDLSNPESIFEKLKDAGGRDEVIITLTEEKVENSDQRKKWPIGTHKVPRWLALHLLSVDN